jgi:cyanophycinase
MSGPLALVGGGEFTEGCSFDADLLRASGGTEVVVLPTADAFESPAKLVDAARSWFAGLDATVVDLHVLQRSDAMDPATAATVRGARFIYLAGSSPMHLRSVLKDTPVWEALLAAWDDGAVVAGSSEAAAALVDPMVDPRGGAFTVGLGLVANLAVLPHAEDDVAAHHRRTLELADEGLVLATIQECTALIRDPDGSWRADGAGAVRVFVDGEERSLDALP